MCYESGKHGSEKRGCETCLMAMRTPLILHIERGADLRQPEVSVSMQELKRRGWIKKRDLKKKGKGRPVHIYRQSTQLSEILKNIEQEKLKEIEGVKKSMLELKNMISNI